MAEIDYCLIPDLAMISQECGGIYEACQGSRYSKKMSHGSSCSMKGGNVTWKERTGLEQC